MSRASPSAGRDLEPGLRSRLLAKLRALEPQPVIGEQLLEISTNTINLESDLVTDAHVQDGLGMLSAAAGMANEIAPCSSNVREIGLVNSTPVHALVFADAHRTRVLSRRLLPAPNVRFFTTHLQPGMVRTVGNLKAVPLTDGGRLLLAMPPIQGQIFPISVLPHRRASINIAALQDAERREFLQQAQLLKRVRSEDGEVIAVFRKVPIEMITSLRYVANADMIVYSISAEPQRSHTRVHDMAAVRDNGTGEVYLVPRRTHVNLELRVTN